MIFNICCIVLSIIFSILCGVYIAFYLKKEQEKYNKKLIELLNKAYKEGQKSREW